jgi:ATP-dependent Zn protease
MTKSQILDQVTMLLGGRVAEAMCFMKSVQVLKMTWNVLQGW